MLSQAASFFAPFPLPFAAPEQRGPLLLSEAKETGEQTARRLLIVENGIDLQRIFETFHSNRPIRAGAVFIVERAWKAEGPLLLCFLRLQTDFV